MAGYFNSPRCSICLQKNKICASSCFCRDCDCYFCSGCHGDHDSFPAMRDHVVVENPKPQVCGRCSQRVTSYRCEECACFYCEECLRSHNVFPAMKKHNVTDVIHDIKPAGKPEKKQKKKFWS